MENIKLKEFNLSLVNKKIAIIGLGVSNIPLLDYLKKFTDKIVVFDNRDIEKIDIKLLNKLKKLNIIYNFGINSLKKLIDFDIIFRSPSCMIEKEEIQAEIKRGAIITSEIEMFIKLFPGKIIAVTGSDGKTTTTSLIYEIIKQKYNCYLGGNIGIPLFTRLKEMKNTDVAVLELSSFQLITLDKSPDISIITNISPNHLDIHKSYEEYIEAKKNIFKYQNTEGIVILNYDNEITKSFEKDIKNKIVYFSRKKELKTGVYLLNDKIIISENGNFKNNINISQIYLRGIHNLENICTAIAATKDLVSIDIIENTIKNFKGVAHRLEYIRTINNVKWYNDSIGSSPTRTIAGLNSFDEKIVLIAGGYDKNLDYSIIAKPILDKVQNLILLGQTKEKIKNAILKESEKTGKKVNIYECKTLEETVQLAKKVAKENEIVLFSPASASFDMFKNFEERGNKFKEIVNNL